MAEDAPELLIRDKKPSDIAFLHRTFYDSRKKHRRTLRFSYPELCADSKRRMNEWLADPEVRVHVATPDDDDDLIAGVCVTRAGVVLWAYTRLSLRGFGVEQALETAARAR